MSKLLKKLLEWARTHVVSDEERWQQRISFAYGNTKMHNDNITREMVEDQASEVDRDLVE